MSLFGMKNKKEVILYHLEQNKGNIYLIQLIKKIGTGSRPKNSHYSLMREVGELINSGRCSLEIVKNHGGIK